MEKEEKEGRGQGSHYHLPRGPKPSTPLVHSDRPGLSSVTGGRGPCKGDGVLAVKIWRKHEGVC